MKDLANVSIWAGGPCAYGYPMCMRDAPWEVRMGIQEIALSATTGLERFEHARVLNNKMRAIQGFGIC